MMEGLRRLQLPFLWIATAANTFGTLVIFGLVAVMNVDVIARGFFHAPLKGVVEMVIFSLILIVFLQLPDVVRHNRLTRSDGFMDILASFTPLGASLLRRFVDFIAGVFMALIAWTLWPEFLDAFATCHFFSEPEFGAPPTGDFWVDFQAAYARCEYFGTPGIFTVPYWPAKLAITFSAVMCALLFFFKALLGSPELTQDPQSTDAANHTDNPQRSARPQNGGAP